MLIAFSRVIDIPVTEICSGSGNTGRGSTWVIVRTQGGGLLSMVPPGALENIQDWVYHDGILHSTLTQISAQCRQCSGDSKI